MKCKSRKVTSSRKLRYLKKSLGQFLFDDFKSGSIMDVVPNLAICICIPSDFCETLVKMGGDLGPYASGATIGVLKQTD